MKMTYILLIVIVGLACILGGYLLAVSNVLNKGVVPINNITQNTTGNNTSTQQSTSQHPQQSLQNTSRSSISPQKAISIAKGTLQDSSQTRATATYSDTGAFPYYEVDIVDDNTKHTTYGQTIFTVDINAQTGEVVSVT